MYIVMDAREVSADRPDTVVVVLRRLHHAAGKVIVPVSCSNRQQTFKTSEYGKAQVF